MCNKSKFLDRFKAEFSERSFDPKETIQWLMSNQGITWSWGYNSATSLSKDELITGLLFNVNGNHHKGWVLITLSGNDTYTLRFFSSEFEETLDKIKDVQNDVLQKFVDESIEKISTYTY